MSGAFSVKEVLRNSMKFVVDSHAKNPLVVVIGYSKYIFPDSPAISSSSTVSSHCSQVNFFTKYHCKFNSKDIPLIENYTQEFVEYETQVIDFFGNGKIENEYGLQSFNFIPLINIPMDDEFRDSLSSKNGCIYQSYHNDPKCDFLLYIVFGFGFKHLSGQPFSRSDLLFDNNFQSLKIENLYRISANKTRISMSYLVLLYYGKHCSLSYYYGIMRSIKRPQKLKVRSLKMVWTGNPERNLKRIKTRRYLKGRLHFSYSCGKPVEIKKWEERKLYTSGDLVLIGIHWSMCLKDHISNNENQPRHSEIFTDLIANVIQDIQQILNIHLCTLSQEISMIVIEYCYAINDHWWNGCCRYSTDSSYFYICGNLCCGIRDLKYCDICCAVANDMNVNEGESFKHNAGRANYGAVLEFDKSNGKVTYSYVSDEKNNVCQLRQKMKRKEFIDYNPSSCGKRKQILHLFIRNFNKDMTPLIILCMDDDKTQPKIFNGIDLGDVHLWALYSSTLSHDLFCAVIWRRVFEDSILMFEVLFLATSEHVRHRKCAQEMVTKIEMYCRQKCFDVISVAAVPVQGILFWSKMGFKMKVASAAAEEGKYYEWRETNFEQYLEQYMLMFADTPLYAKILAI